MEQSSFKKAILVMHPDPIIPNGFHNYKTIEKTMKEIMFTCNRPTFKAVLMIKIVRMYTNLDSCLTYNIIVENMLENETLLEQTTQIQDE